MKNTFEAKNGKNSLEVERILFRILKGIKGN